MPTSVIGTSLVANISQNQSAPSGQYGGIVLVEVTFQASKLPTEFHGWAYLLYTSGGAGGIFRSALVKRAAITSLGCVIQIPNIIGISQGGDTFRGHQLYLEWRRAGIDFAVRNS
jgi:hypothetical protein